VLTGQTVFDASTPAQMLLHHAQTTPVPPSRRSELHIPAGLETVLMKCLEKNPADRVGSAIDLEAELERVQRDLPWTTRRAREWWEVHAPDAIDAGLR
jgi:serine/threonine-protein kinase